MGILDGNSETEIETRADDIVALLDKEEAAQGGAPEQAQPQNQPQAETAAADESDPVETPVIGKEDGHSDPETPVIAPPDSWTAEAKDAFAKLPRDLQSVIAERDAAQKATFNRQVNEAAEHRKAAEAERQTLATQAEAVSQERQRYAQTLTTLAQRLYSQDPILLAEASTDWVKLWEEAPADAGRRQALVQQRIGQINGFVQNLAKEHDELQGKTQAEHAAKMKAHLDEQNKLLVQKVPEWADQTVGVKAIAAIREDLVSTYGFTPQEAAGIIDHRQALVAKDALAYRRLKAEVDAEKAKTAKAAAAIGEKRVQTPAAKVARPGNANEQRGDRSERSNALINQAMKTRNIHDAAALIAEAI